MVELAGLAGQNQTTSPTAHLAHELYRETHPIPTAETTPASEAEAKRGERGTEFAAAATFPP